MKSSSDSMSDTSTSFNRLFSRNALYCSGLTPVLSTRKNPEAFRLLHDNLCKSPDSGKRPGIEGMLHRLIPREARP
jgi:hypothetical protein